MKFKEINEKVIDLDKNMQKIALKELTRIEKEVKEALKEAKSGLIQQKTDEYSSVLYKLSEAFENITANIAGTAEDYKD